MVSIETRCTQCGDENKVDVPTHELNHGAGKSHGAENAFCPECSDECDLDECEYGDPCERCREETVQNRRGASVPTPRQ